MRRHVADNGERNQAANGDLQCIASCRGTDANHHKVQSPQNFAGEEKNAERRSKRGLP
jgi:hypothetical protein